VCVCVCVCVCECVCIHTILSRSHAHRMTRVLDGVDNGQLLNIGPIYKFQTGDSLMGVAGRFRTTVKSLLDLNPDILDPAKVATGQEICMVPCSY